MSDVENREKQEKEKKLWLMQMKRMVLAGMGAVALAQDEMEGFVNKLVERGELAEQEGKKWIKESLEKGRKQTADTVHSIEENSLESLEKLLEKLNIPTKKDLHKLSERVECLAQKVDELAKKQGCTQPPQAPENPQS